jgi:hypothetical protein
VSVQSLAVFLQVVLQPTKPYSAQQWREALSRSVEEAEGESTVIKTGWAERMAQGTSSHHCKPIAGEIASASWSTY